MFTSLFILTVNLSLLWAAESPSELIFRDAITYESPEEGSFSISRDVAIDDGGFLYHLDESGVLVVWDPNGKVISQLGGKGEGPGEFQMAYSRGFMTYNGDYVIVVDQNRFTFFKDGAFSHSLPKPTTMQIIDFQAIDADSYLAIYRTYFGNKKERQLTGHVVILDANFVPTVELTSQREQSYSRNKEGGWLYQPYAPRIVAAVGNGEIYVARTDENWIQVFDLNGLPTRKLKTDLVPSPVPEYDKQSQRKTFESWRTERDSIKLAEYDSTIDSFIPLNEDMIVICQYKSSGLHKGIVMNPQTSEVIGKFTVYLGEHGRLFSSNSQLIMSRTDDHGSTHIMKVLPVFTREALP